MVSLKIQKRLKIDFLKNSFLLVIGILLIIIIILIIYNYFNKKSKNIERFYFEDNFIANPENCEKINSASTNDEKRQCCDKYLDNINDSHKSVCPAIDSKKYCTSKYDKYRFGDDC